MALKMVINLLFIKITTGKENLDISDLACLSGTRRIKATDGFGIVTQAAGGTVLANALRSFNLAAKRARLGCVLRQLISGKRKSR